MQTSFMHPPFGFALFYLRSVAPREPYLDRVTGKRMEPVTTGQIYWGAVPFVVIQCIMVALVIAFPAMVMHYKGAGPQVDPSKIQIEIPQIEPAAARLDHRRRSAERRTQIARRKRPGAQTLAGPCAGRRIRSQVRVRMRIMKLSKPSSATCNHR